MALTHLRSMMVQRSPAAQHRSPALSPAPMQRAPAFARAPALARAPTLAPANPPTPAQSALPITPAAEAMVAAMPASAPAGANTPVREETYETMAPSTMMQPAASTAPLLAPSQILTPAAIAATAPPPTSVAHAMSMIASSAPGYQQRRGPGTAIHPVSNAPKYAIAPTGADAANRQGPQTRHAAQGSQIMSKGFQRTERRIYCPINSAGNVAAAGTQTITQRPQVNFQPDQLIVSPAVAGFFTINSWSVGIQPQQAAGGAVNSDMFPANGAHFNWDVCDTGTDIIMSVTNNDAAVHAFSAMLVGYQVEITGS